MTGERPNYKFQRLQIYQFGLDYVSGMYALTQKLPRTEDLNVRSQLQRATTSIVLNLAEGSTGQIHREQSRFLGLAGRSLMECVASLGLVERHRYATNEELLATRELGHHLVTKVQAMRRSLEKSRGVQAGRRSPVAGHREER